jgi:hypothetical protein
LDTGWRKTKTLKPIEAVSLGVWRSAGAFREDSKLPTAAIIPRRWVSGRRDGNARSLSAKTLETVTLLAAVSALLSGVAVALRSSVTTGKHLGIVHAEDSYDRGRPLMKADIFVQQAERTAKIVEALHGARYNVRHP